MICKASWFDTLAQMALSPNGFKGGQFWETEADLQATSLVFQEVKTKIAPLLSATPVPEDLEVMIQV